MASRSKQSLERENDEAESDQLITAKRLRELLGGVSEMHIWRLLSLEAYRPLQFPRPTKINGRNYWSLREVNAWIRQRFDASRHAQAA